MTTSLASITQFCVNYSGTTCKLFCYNMKVQTGCWDCWEEKGQAAAGRKVPVNAKEWQLKPLRREKEDYSGAWVQWKLHQKRSDSVLHTWENSDPTPVCTLISTIDIWDSAELWISWNHRKPMEYTCSYEGIQPSSSPSGHLQILGDLVVACSSRSTISQKWNRGVSNHWTRIWNGTTEWKIEWISKCMQLQLTCVTGAAYSVS